MKKLRTSHGGRSPAGIVNDSTWQVFAINQVAARSRTGGRSVQFTCSDIDECTVGTDYCTSEGKSFKYVHGQKYESPQSAFA